MVRLFARMRVADYESWRKEYDAFYGERGGTIRDPFGHDWLIGHNIEDVAPEEMQRRYTKLMSGS